MSRRTLLIVLLGLLAVVGISQLPKLGGKVERAALPLGHASVIREQGSAKGIPPDLIAGVIYAESRFRPRRSSAGAEGLMQILPSTAQFIARQSGGTAFTASDLADPAVNIRYGSWYLRYLLQRYGGNQVEALAAYNAGMANVDRWKAESAAAGRVFSEEDIAFPETAAYVDRVLAAAGDYRRVYGRELGIR